MEDEFPKNERKSDVYLIVQNLFFKKTGNSIVYYLLILFVLREEKRAGQE